MKLLVFAHRAEAQAFLSKIPFKKEEGLRVDYYESSQHKLSLVICSEGVDEALKNLTYILTHLETNQSLPVEVINMGVAGSVNSKLNLSQVYSIRTSYRFLDSDPIFKSQSSCDPLAKVDCISTNQRIISSQDANKLQVHGDIVDRELWGIAQACRFFKLPFSCYKMISDYAGETNCELIADKGNEYSFELFNYFIKTSALSNSPLKDTKKLNSNISDFIDKLSPTFSQRVQIEKLFEACSSRELDTSTVLAIAEDEKYQDWPRKKRNQFIINSLVQIADPIQAKLNDLCSELSNTFCKAITHTENPTVEIKAKIGSKAQLNLLIEQLENFPISKLEDFYQGKI